MVRGPGYSRYTSCGAHWAHASQCGKVPSNSAYKRWVSTESPLLVPLTDLGVGCPPGSLFVARLFCCVVTRCRFPGICLAQRSPMATLAWLTRYAVNMAERPPILPLMGSTPLACQGRPLPPSPLGLPKSSQMAPLTGSRDDSCDSCLWLV